MRNLAPIGHNLPPSEIEILKQRLADYKDEADLLDRLSSKEIPDEITQDEEAGIISDHIAAVKALFSKIAAIHKKEKQPFLDAGRAADAWKNDYEAKTNVLIDKASAPLLAWNKKKEAAERQRQLEIARKAAQEAEALRLEAAAHALEGIDDTAHELMEAAAQEDSKADMIINNTVQIKPKSIGGFSSSGIKREWKGEIDSMAAIDLEALRKYFKEEDVLSALNRAVKDGLRNVRGARIFEHEQLTNRRK